MNAGWHPDSPSSWGIPDNSSGLDFKEESLTCHIAVDVPEGYAVCQALSAREIVVDYRPDAGLRVAPHFYNTRDEVRGCMQAVRDILDSGEHLPFLQQERKPG